MGSGTDTQGARSLAARAAALATAGGERIAQRRPYGRSPHQTHLKRVAEIVAGVTDDEETIAAAWLHEAVEDTPTTLDRLEAELGPAVAALVGDLTSVSRPGEGTRAARAAAERAHLAAASPRAKTVKLADLVDTCRDVCTHDRRLARRFVSEMLELLPVLGDGDARLWARAEGLAKEAARDLGLPLPPVPVAVPAAPGAAGPLWLRQWGNAGFQQFIGVFRSGDIAEALRSFDDTTDAAAARAAMVAAGVRVAGARSEGRVTRYLRLEDLGDGPCGSFARPFQPGQVVAARAPLSAVIHVLSRHDHCFVEVGGEVGAAVTRDDVGKPVVRMWLFGIVTILESQLTRHIRGRWPDEGWRALLSPERVRRAEELRQERARRGQERELVECLQLGDKAVVLLADDAWLELFDLPSRAAGRKAFAAIESLRNNLAHSQDIVAEDWLQIVRFSRRVEEAVAAASEGDDPGRP